MKLIDWLRRLFDPGKDVPEEAFATEEEFLKMFAAEEEDEWDAGN